jgi:hypothetical protein
MRDVNVSLRRVRNARTGIFFPLSCPSLPQSEEMDAI